MESYLKNIISKSNVNYLEIRIVDTKRTIVNYQGRELENIGTSTSYGGSIRANTGGGWGFISFNELDKLEFYLEQVIKSARLVDSHKIDIKESKPVNMKKKLGYEIDPAEKSLEEKQKLISGYNNIMLSSPKIQSTGAFYLDTKQNYIYANSEGSFIQLEKTFTGISLSAIARDGNNIRTYHNSFAGYEGYEKVLEREKDAEGVAKKAVELLSAEPVTAGKYTVILDPKLTGVFIHEAFGHLSEADAAYENPKLLEIMKIGNRFGNDDLCVVDDGSMEKASGYIVCDDEGVLSKKTYLIKDGIFNSRLHSRQTAGALNEELTGNARADSYSSQPIVRMTNTYLEPRRDKFPEMAQSIDNGIYAISYNGGMTALEMFTFSAALAYKIEKGKITKMLKDVVLSGNVFETLKNIDMIGDDLSIISDLGNCGKQGQGVPVSLGGPHIKIKNVVVGGK